jgi:hypothetical protein
MDMHYLYEGKVMMMMIIIIIILQALFSVEGMAQV